MEDGGCIQGRVELPAQQDTTDAVPKMSYVPPHLRGKRQDQPAKETPTSQAPVQDRSCTKDELERDSEESQMIAAAFAITPGYKAWDEARKRGETNTRMTEFFGGRAIRSAPRSGAPPRRRTMDAGAVNRLFNKFCRYALDINHGVHYVEHAAELARAREGKAKAVDRLVWALDFGFAPGGMVELLLDAHPNIRVIGVTLDPDSSGDNSFPEDFGRGRSQDEAGGWRFFPLLADVMHLSRHEPRTIPSMVQDKWPDMFSVADFCGFDLAIIGITASNNKEGDGLIEYNGIKDLLHLAQLELIFREGTMRPGAAVLMRMHMSLRLVDFHLHCFMLYNCGYLEGDGDTPVTTKPMTEFAFRGTYWALYVGFKMRPGSWERLRDLMQSSWGRSGPYLYLEDQRAFVHPVLVEELIDEALKKFGPLVVRMLEPSWMRQTEALEGMMGGWKMSLCHNPRCSNGASCRGAHDDAELVPACREGFRNVDREFARFMRDENALGGHGINLSDAPMHPSPGWAGSSQRSPGHPGGGAGRAYSTAGQPGGSVSRGHLSPGQSGGNAGNPNARYMAPPGVAWPLPAPGPGSDATLGREPGSGRGAWGRGGIVRGGQGSER